ncbi:putative ATP-grasp-modified RiPP [Streptomyces sp. NPDC052721]|uniref:putative ATP-grasp-modified RiPP n=1 Tax=Streptomyces sp. NPDC052721 TaxID=3154955 RepID=UPI0034397599
METAVRDQITPWGVSRMKPFPDAVVLPAVRAVLDAETQTAVWVDPDGNPAPTMDKHKRSETSKETSTKTSLDGNSDQGSDQSGDSD